MKTRPEFLRRRSFQGRFKQIMASVFAFAFVALCMGCGGETHRQLFKRYESQFAEKRAQFKKIAQMLPAPGSVKEPTTANLSPKPVYDARSGTYNTEIVMYDQLLDPDIQSHDHTRLDLLLSGDLLVCMQWTGPKNPMSDSVLDKSAGDAEQELKAALALQYLAVLRPATFVAPVAVDESTYKAGTADIEGFIVDMNRNSIVGSFRFNAKSASQVEYSAKKSENKESRLEEFAYSSLYTDALQKLGPLLQQTTGGHFVLEK